MANLKIYPTKLRGRVKIPPSKSIAHRAIICASLSDKICKIENIDYSDDIIATIEGMKALGASIVRYDDYLQGNNPLKYLHFDVRLLPRRSLTHHGIHTQRWFCVQDSKHASSLSDY